VRESRGAQQGTQSLGIPPPSIQPLHVHLAADAGLLMLQNWLTDAGKAGLPMQEKLAC
jgi:hypothetical protein